MFEDGSLNFKYFNVKKGHYWSKEENERLIEGVLKHGACQFKTIKREFFHGKGGSGGSNWSETEIRLRICRLLKCYDLSVYENREFSSKSEILECARKNKEDAVSTKRVCGGILYNPSSATDKIAGGKEVEGEDGAGIINSFFNKSRGQGPAANASPV